ncbi:MAG: hypothetical protein EBU90_27035, partial [Proteobacteria bacterium]|nr:hypothetical protein [Pseudomonadota bacterium]
SQVVRNAQTVEYGKFVEIQNDSRFPAISVVRIEEWDKSSAFPNNTGKPPLTSVDVYPKYAVLTYDVSTGQTNGTPFGDNASVDAFGRLRTSTPHTLLDSKNIYSKNTLLFDEVLSGTATSTFSAYDSCVDLKTAASGDYVIRQTRVRYNYQPGKSMQYMFTGVFEPQANIIKRVGAFQSLTAAPYEPSDGMFMEITNNGPAFRVIKTQGTPHTHYAAQSAWNVDRFDGTGPSGITIDFTKAVLFTIDYEWLAVGRIRFGFFINGRCYYAHYNGHMGELTGPYMTFSNQPVRYEIRQTGSESGLLRQICSTVMIEGSTENIGKSYNIAENIITAQDGIYTPILGLRVNPATPNLINVIKQYDVVNTGNKPAHVALFLNPQLTGGTLTYTPVANTIMLSSAGSGAISVVEGVSGYRLIGSFCAVGQVGQSAPTGKEDVYGDVARFGTGIRGDPDTVILAAKGLGGSTTVYGSINLLEKG